MIWNILILNHSNRNINIFWERVPFSALLQYAAVTGQRCESTFHCSNLSECDWFWSNSPGTKPASAVYCVGRAWNPPRWRIKMESSIVKVQSVKWDRKISASSISLISLNQSIDSVSDRPSVQQPTDATKSTNIVFDRVNKNARKLVSTTG